MSKHSPIIRLQDARDELDRAYAACPHGDYEAGTHEGAAHECCYRVDEARRELRNARNLVARIARR